MVATNSVDNHHDEGEVDSADEALMSMLGLADLDVPEQEEEEAEGPTPSNGLADHQTAQIRALSAEYLRDGVCTLPLKVQSNLIRRLADELVWGGDQARADKSYETIKSIKQGEIHEQRTLTRLENFVENHEGWKHLCYGFLQDCISALWGEPMVLFKEKLNLKPPGGSGFAPHLDGPSLRVALGSEGPKRFVTVMVAIDSMTTLNGCLRVSKGNWTEENATEVIEPEQDGNPDAGGRAGAIPAQVAEGLEFDDIACDGGSIVAFGEWTPHRSAANASPFPRRAVFLTYNPASEGDHRANYYQKMEAMRNEWRDKIGLTKQREWEEDRQRDLEALASVPH